MRNIVVGVGFICVLLAGLSVLVQLSPAPIERLIPPAPTPTMTTEQQRLIDDVVRNVEYKVQRCRAAQYSHEMTPQQYHDECGYLDD